MGKNFSGNNTGKRNKNDFYQTPYSITRQLLDETNCLENIMVDDSVLEPACGQGSIVRILLESYLKKDEVDFYDKYHRRKIRRKDFLKDNFKKYDWIITNPLFQKLLNLFIGLKK